MDFSGQPNSYNIIPCCVLLAKKEKKLVSFKNVLDEKIQMINCINLNHWEHCLKVFCDKMGSTQKALLLRTKVHTQLSWRNAPGRLSCALNKNPFFIECEFYLTEWQTDKLRLFRSRYLENIFLKTPKDSWEWNKPVT